jgi:hypothetical protein
MRFLDVDIPSLKKAVKMAIKVAVEKGILPDIIKDNDPEVFSMIYEELLVKEELEYAYNHGFEKGREEGIKIGIEEKRNEICVKVAKKLLCNSKIEIDTVIEATGLERDEALRLRAEFEVC